MVLLRGQQISSMRKIHQIAPSIARAPAAEPISWPANNVNLTCSVCTPRGTLYSNKLSRMLVRQSLSDLSGRL